MSGNDGKFSRRKWLTGAGATAAALASQQPVEAQTATPMPIDWSDNSFNGTKNIPSFNQAIAYDYYSDLAWTLKPEFANDGNIQRYNEARNITLNQIPNSVKGYGVRYAPGMFKDEQKQVIEITNARDAISKTVVQPPLVGSGQKAPKEIEYVISNPVDATPFDPKPDNKDKLVRPGSKTNGILVIPEEAVKKDNIGFSMSREGNDVVITLATFNPDNKNDQIPVQVTRYVLKDQLDDTKHPPITKIYVASRDKVREPIQMNALDSKIKNEDLPSSGEAPGYQSMNQYTMLGKDRKIGNTLKYVNPFFFMDSLVTGILGMSEGTLRHVNRIDPATGKDETLPGTGVDGPKRYREIESYELKDISRVGRNFAAVGTTTFGVYNPDRSRENEYAAAPAKKGPLDHANRPPQGRDGIPG